MNKILKEPSIWLLIFLVGFPQVSETIYTPSLPELARMLNTSGNAIQQTLSIYFLGFAAGVVLWGILADKIGRRLSMLCGILVYIIGSIGCLLAQQVEVLLFSRFVQALGAATGSVVTQTIMRDCYDDNRRPRMFAKVSAVLAFSPAVGPLLGGFISENLGVRYVFATLIFIGVLAGILSLLFLNETKGESNSKSFDIPIIIKRMFLDKYIWIFGAFIGIINGVIFSYYAEAPFIFIECLKLSVSQYGYIGVVVAVASFVGAVVGNKLLKKKYYVRVMQIGYVVMILGTMLILLAAFLNLSNLLITLIMLAGVFLVMAGIGIALPSCLSNALVNYKDCLGISGAFLSMYYYVIVSLCTWLMSFIHTGDMYCLPLFLLGLSMLLLTISLTLKKY